MARPSLYFHRETLMAIGSATALALMGFLLRNDDTAGTFWSELGSGVLPSVIAGDLFFALHVADPVFGSQDTDELAWLGTNPYARQPISREMLSWNEDAGTFVLNADIDFGIKDDAGTLQASNFSIGTRLTGPGFIVLTGPMSFETSRPFVVDNSLDGNRLIIPGHQFFVGAQIQFREDIGGSGLPSGINSSGFWFVVSVNPDGIQISATAGGAALPLGNGSGRCALSDVFVIIEGNNVLIPSGSLTVAIG